MKKTLVTLLLLLAGIAALSAAERTDSVRVLFIGNSYTYYNDLPEMVSRLASELPAGESMAIAHRQFTPGGCTLRKHWNNEALRDSIASGRWDYVVIQENSSVPAKSTASVMRESYPYAAKLDSLVKSCNPEAKVIYYMTWGHKNGCQKKHDGYPLIDTYDGMQGRVMTSYLEMAYDNDSWCAPVGMAWRSMRALRPDVELYNPDCTHPSEAGSYLAANVILATILQKPFESGYKAGLSPELARYIQTLANNTVLGNLKVINAGGNK